jgi:hypothetical protein
VRHVAGIDTSPASSASRRSASPGSPGLIPAPLATVPASRGSRPIAVLHQVEEILGAELTVGYRPAKIGEARSELRKRLAV